MSPRALLLLILAALLTWPALGLAHISVVPATADTGVETPFVVRIPNETGVAMTTARVSFPSGIRVTGPLTPPAGWTVNSLAGQGTDLGGGDYDGELPSGEQLEVTILATPLVPGEAVWRVEQTFADGSRVLWTADPDPTASEEPGPGEPGPAFATTISGASLEPPPAAATPDAPEPPQAPPADPDTGDIEMGAEPDDSDIASWILVVVGAIALLALGAVGWMWSNRPLDLPPDED